MGSFDSLKREAVQLERQLEDKVNRFQQSVSSNASGSTNSNLDPLDYAEMGTSEIPSLLQQLGTVLKKLQPAAVTPSQRAIVQRYTDIMRQYQHDYDKSLQIQKRNKERNELLGGASPSSGNNNGQDDGMDALLRERNHINNSMNAAANVIGQAESIRHDLHYQGRSLRTTTGLMGQIAGNIPGINTLINQIQRKRSRDDKIVAGVISTCIVFTLWYMFG